MQGSTGGEVHPGAGLCALHAGCREDAESCPSPRLPPLLPPLLQEATGHTDCTLQHQDARMGKSLAVAHKWKHRIHMTQQPLSWVCILEN